MCTLYTTMHILYTTMCTLYTTMYTLSNFVRSTTSDTREGKKPRGTSDLKKKKNQVQLWIVNACEMLVAK